nr:hypothetical protein [uncultured Blautia sp.]
MKKIVLDTVSPLHKTGHTSKGDQRKWKIEDTWCKADYMGYESLSEVMVSALLERSSLSYPFVSYQHVRIEYKGNMINGCSSRDFLQQDQILIPVEKLYRQYTGESLAVKLSEFQDVSEKIQYLVEEMEEITHIEDFGKYITAILEIDAFFLNEDRHTNNIAVIYNEKTGQYSLSPIFDQGLCLFSDTSYDYPIDLSVEKCMEKIEAKPFHSDFDVQLETAEELYGNQIEFMFTIKDVQEILNQFERSYSDKIRERVESLLRTQIRKYAYLMRRPQ